MFCRLLFLLSIISPFILSAQIATEIKLEPAMVTVKYERKVEMDTLDRGNKARTTILTLKAGKIIAHSMMPNGNGLTQLSIGMMIFPCAIQWQGVL